MADKKTNLAIIIEAVNNASKQLNQVEKDLGKLSGAVEEQGEVASTAALGFGELVAGVASGTVIANLAMAAFQKLTSAIIDIPRALFDIAVAASEVEGLGIKSLVVVRRVPVYPRDHYVTLYR